MSSSLVIESSVFNPSTHVEYGRPRVNKSGGKSIAVLNKGTGEPLRISTPLMMTWGADEYVDEASGRSSYSMSLQFPGEGAESSATDTFLACMRALDEKLRQDAKTNSKAWFNKANMSLDVIDALRTPLLRHPYNQDTGEPDESRAPSMKVKLPFWDGKFDCEIYDAQGRALFPAPHGEPQCSPMDLIPKRCKTAVVMKSGGIWFAGGKFGMTWRLEQAVVQPKQTIRGVCQIKLSADDVATMEEEGGDEADGVAAAIVEDSDEEEDEEPEPVAEPEPEAEPEPAPVVAAPVKKVVRRRKKKVASADA